MKTSNLPLTVPSPSPPARRPQPARMLCSLYSVLCNPHVWTLKLNHPEMGLLDYPAPPATVHILYSVLCNPHVGRLYSVL